MKEKGNGKRGGENIPSNRANGASNGAPKGFSVEEANFPQRLPQTLVVLLSFGQFSTVVIIDLITTI
jgi:hypothetical protein